MLLSLTGYTVWVKTYLPTSLRYWRTARAKMAWNHILSKMKHFKLSLGLQNKLPWFTCLISPTSSTAYLGPPCLWLLWSWKIPHATDRASWWQECYCTYRGLFWADIQVHGYNTWSTVCDFFYGHLYMSHLVNYVNFISSIPGHNVTFVLVPKTLYKM